jgi:hypothetical protein
MMALWGVTLLDFARSVVEAHLRREANMTRDSFMRFSGWALTLGGFTFALFWTDIVLEGPIFGPSWATGLNKQLQAASYIGSALCLALGFLGLRLRFGLEVGRMGSMALFAGTAAAILTIPVGNAQEVGQLHPVWLYVLPLIWSVCLLLVGAEVLRQKTEPRSGWLLVLAGGGWPLALAAYALNDLAPSALSSVLMPLGLAGFAVVAVGCALLGFRLMAGRRKPLTPA